MNKSFIFVTLLILSFPLYSQSIYNDWEHIKKDGFEKRKFRNLQDWIDNRITYEEYCQKNAEATASYYESRDAGQAAYDECIKKKEEAAKRGKLYRQPYQHSQP